MKKSKVLVSAILAGMSIGFGGTVFLMLDNKVIGSALFTIGLFVVCTFGLHLFTGKVCYALENNAEYAVNLIVIWLGNLIGTGLVAMADSLTRNGAALSEKAMSLCAVKMNDSFLSLFILAILCNIFIYIGVEGFKNNQHEVGKYLSLFLGVMVFILCGTEHCVADMFYFWMAGAWSAKSVVCLLIITLGNAVGGVIFPVLRGYLNK